MKVLKLTEENLVLDKNGDGFEDKNKNVYVNVNNILFFNEIDNPRKGGQKEVVTLIQLLDNNKIIALETIDEIFRQLSMLNKLNNNDNLFSE